MDSNWVLMAGALICLILQIIGFIQDIRKHQRIQKLFTNTKKD